MGTYPPEYAIDPDNIMVLDHFDHPKDALVLEVGANDECASQWLTDQGYRVLGIDLRKFNVGYRVNYPRLIGDFCQLASMGVLPKFDVIFSTSAIEHFGLGTYGEGYVNPDYDVIALAYMHDLLVDGGFCHITVPYGKEFIVSGKDWRVYNHEHLRRRIIQNFQVVEKKFFHSAGCHAPCDTEGMVKEEDADQYNGNPPHVGVYLKMCKCA